VLANLVGNGGCRPSRASGEDLGDDVVGPAVGQVAWYAGQRQDGRPLIAILDEPDLFTRRLADAVVGTESFDLAGELTVHPLEFVEFGLALDEFFVLVEPGAHR